jgi:hypothetical protein
MMPEKDGTEMLLKYFDDLLDMIAVLNTRVLVLERSYCRHNPDRAPEMEQDFIEISKNVSDLRVKYGRKSPD